MEHGTEARIASSAELARFREIQQILQPSGTKEVQFGPQPARHTAAFS